jgi:DNA-directed RNA polymerase subunit RPC12/RpoP
MQFRVGSISAKCPKCGATQFRIPHPDDYGPRMSYQCTGCGQPTQYAKLITQIGREAIAQRNARLSGERADRVRAGLS